jgi:hypothetical protein
MTTLLIPQQLSGSFGYGSVRCGPEIGGRARQQKSKGLPPSREQIARAFIQMTQQANQMKNFANMRKQCGKFLDKDHIEIKNGKIKQLNIAAPPNKITNFIKIK